MVAWCTSCFFSLVLMWHQLAPSSAVPTSAGHQPVTREEALHIGVAYTEPPIVNEFKKSEIYLRSSDPLVNDFVRHHRLVESFCTARNRNSDGDNESDISSRMRFRSGGDSSSAESGDDNGCTWWQYYRLLDDVLRLEYSKLFDPGLASTMGEPLRDIMDATVESCKVLEVDPTAEEFWREYVLPSRPVIIRRPTPLSTVTASAQANAKRGDTSSDIPPSSAGWSLSNLDRVLGSKSVVVSASPSSDFDGPEDLSLWGLTSADVLARTGIKTGSVSGTDTGPTDVGIADYSPTSTRSTTGIGQRSNTIKSKGKDKLPRENIPDLIARPAHLQLTFSDYIQLIQNQHQNAHMTASNLYLEYFPMAALFGELSSSGSSGGKKLQTRREKATDEALRKSLIRSLPQSKYANFLSQRYHLLWLSGGGGGSVGEARDIHREKSSNSSHQHQSTTTTTTTSRMHFDRMENLMSVISGAKTFTLYPPTESTRLYAGGPCISASLSATLTRNQSGRSRGSITNIHFSREQKNINFEVNRHHTYAPVNVKEPDYTRFPLLQQAQGFQCRVQAGDTLYLPAHWWHEVTSESDEEGKCIGVNRFFEPVYLRPQYNTSLEFFQRSRYYGHLHTSKRAVPCSEDKVCFATPVSGAKRSLLQKEKEKDVATNYDYASQDDLGNSGGFCASEDQCVLAEDDGSTQTHHDQQHWNEKRRRKRVVGKSKGKKRIRVTSRRRPVQSSNDNINDVGRRPNRRWGKRSAGGRRSQRDMENK